MFRIHNNRSDQIRSYYVDKSKAQIPLDWLERFLKPIPANELDVRVILENQYEPFIGHEGTLRGLHSDRSTFQGTIGETAVDVILLDNFMDTVAKLLVLRENPNGFGPVFFPAHLNSNLKEIEDTFEFDDYLKPEESAQNWVEIGKWMRQMHPNALVYHICWSHSTSRKEPERLKRILDFYDAYKEFSKGTGIRVIPPLDVEDGLTAGPDDWYHLHDNMYAALAGHIYLDAVSSGLPLGISETAASLNAASGPAPSR